jgi:hypothetical protein
MKRMRAVYDEDMTMQSPAGRSGCWHDGAPHRPLPCRVVGVGVISLDTSPACHLRKWGLRCTTLRVLEDGGWISRRTDPNNHSRTETFDSSCSHDAMNPYCPRCRRPLAKEGGERGEVASQSATRVKSRRACGEP